MLRIQNRLKHDNAELLGLVDRCSQILKDDRLILRQMIKDTNPEVISLLTTYKKKNDLRLLQQELRKLLNKFKGKTPAIIRNSKENTTNTAEIKTSKTPIRQTTREQMLTLRVRSPTSQSKSQQRPVKTSEAKVKQEPSPRFNEEIKQQLDFNYISPNKIEQQRQQLEQFEQKLKLYTSGDNFSKLFESESQQAIRPKRDEIVLASFQNFNPVGDENSATLEMQSEKFSTAHKRQPSYVDIQNEHFHHHHNTEIIEIKDNNFHIEEITNRDSAKRIVLNRKDIIQMHFDSNTNSNFKDKDILNNKNINNSNTKKYNKNNIEIDNNNQNNNNNRINNNNDYIPISEDDIMKKYADLFTAPEFLKQCRASCPTTQKTQESFVDSQKFNFLVPCQSMVCQNEWEQQQQPDVKREYNILSQLTSEQIFDEIFPEPTLHKISKAFFRFKMESVFNQLAYNPTQKELDELFTVVDNEQDGFIDINEMGTYLDQVCPHEDRKIFEHLDRDGKGYFSLQDLEERLLEIGNDYRLKDFSQNYFLECDIMQTNRMNYWDFYLKRNTEIGGELLHLLKEYFDLM